MTAFDRQSIPFRCGGHPTCNYFDYDEDRALVLQEPISPSHEIGEKEKMDDIHQYFYDSLAKKRLPRDKTHFSLFPLGKFGGDSITRSDFNSQGMFDDTQTCRPLYKRPSVMPSFDGLTTHKDQFRPPYFRGNFKSKGEESTQNLYRDPLIKPKESNLPQSMEYSKPNSGQTELSNQYGLDYSTTNGSTFTSMHPNAYKKENNFVILPPKIYLVEPDPKARKCGRTIHQTDFIYYVKEPDNPKGIVHSKELFECCDYPSGKNKYRYNCSSFPADLK